MGDPHRWYSSLEIWLVCTHNNNNKIIPSKMLIVLLLRNPSLEISSNI